MFKEIESELYSILSDDDVEKIINTPNKEISKTLELIYNIKFENVDRVYTQKLENMTRLVVIHKTESKNIDTDICPIGGRIYHITMIPNMVLNKDENNAITLTKAIATYVSIRVGIIADQYHTMRKNTKDNTLDLVLLQAIPVVTSAVIRKVYSGSSIPRIIYMALSELYVHYKNLTSINGIQSIFKLFDEGLGVEDLIDNGFICTISANDTKYPGIWGESKKEENNKDD